MIQFINNKTTKPGNLRKLKLLIRRIIGRPVLKEYYDSTGSIFIHIPKAAGKSVATTLYGDDKPGHYYASDYYMENKLKFNDFYKFTFVRDPVERLKSAYYFLIEGGGSAGDKKFGRELKKQTASFDDFVLNWLDEDRLYSWIHFVPQYEFLCIDGKLAVDYVGRFENITKNFADVASKINCNNKLAEINKTKSQKIEVLNGLVIDKIRHLYQRDIELFGY